MTQKQPSEVTLGDIYERLGMLEAGQADLKADLAGLKGSLNGGTHLKERVERLEARWWMVVGGAGLLAFLVGVAAVVVAIVAL